MSDGPRDPDVGVDPDGTDPGVGGVRVDAASVAAVGLAPGVRDTPEGAAWADTVPGRLRALGTRWSLVSLSALPHSGTGAWIGECVARDGAAGILKLAFPHEEGRDEIVGLGLWDGDPTVRLLRHDRTLDALLLERCTPGESLSGRPEPEQDEVIGSLLRRLRRAPCTGLRPLASLVAVWERAAGTDVAHARPDELETGRAELRALLESDATPCALATDLHAGNVLSAERRPWLAIDPKPYAGDPAFDVTQHLLNCPDRLREAPEATVARVAGAAGVDPARARRWLVARLRVESCPDVELARALLSRLAAGG